MNHTSCSPHRAGNDYHERMNSQNSNNVRLRELVAESGATQAVALTIFNRELGAQACHMATFKAFLAEPGSATFVALTDDLLVHAEKQFARLGPNHQDVAKEQNT